VSAQTITITITTITKLHNMSQQQTSVQWGEEEWSRVAKQYRGLGNLSHLHAKENLDRLQLTLEDRFVVDVAAGTGAFALQAARELKRLRGEAGQSMDGVRVLATDFADAMVGACRYEAEAQGLNDIVECKQMDGQVRTHLCQAPSRSAL
jgi:ubiquinone/menaquinone biosynthesis C-methylase UbiE